eukprot:555493-Rhodomonas_salina.3
MRIAALEDMLRKRTGCREPVVASAVPQRRWRDSRHARAEPQAPRLPQAILAAREQHPPTHMT